MKALTSSKTVFRQSTMLGLLGGVMLCSATLSHAENAPADSDGVREFIVSGAFDRAPYQFLDEAGKPTGFDVELMAAVARSAGLTVTFQKPGPSDVYAPDVRLSASFVKDTVRYSQPEVWQYLAPHSEQEHAIFVREDSLYRDFNDLANRDILVANGSHAKEWLSYHGHKSHLIGAGSVAGALTILSQGNYEAVVCDRYEGLQARLDAGIENVRVLGDSIIPVETGFAILRHDEKLAKSLKSGMRVVQNTGEFEALQKRWFASLEPETKTLKLGAAYSYALWVLIPALIFLGSACISYFTVKKKALARIKELEHQLELERERTDVLEMEHARQRYVINQMSAVSLVEQLAGVSGNNRDY